MLQGDCRVKPSLRDFNLFAAQTQLLDVKNRQCLVVTDNTFVSATNKMWLSKLYVRLTDPAADSAILFAENGDPIEWPKPVFVRASGADGGLWMTEVTLQGDGIREAQGLDAATAVVATGAPLTCISVTQICPLEHAKTSESRLLISCTPRLCSCTRVYIAS